MLLEMYTISVIALHGWVLFNAALEGRHRDVVMMGLGSSIYIPLYGRIFGWW